MALKKRDRGTPIVIHHSLSNEIMIAGVPRDYAFVNAALGGILGFSGGAYYILPIFFITHYILAYLHREDPQYWDCMVKHYNTKDFYGV